MLTSIYNIIVFTTMVYKNRNLIKMVTKPVLLYILRNINLKRIRYNIKVSLTNLSQRIQIMENYI